MILLVRVGREEEFWKVEGCEGSWMFKTSAPLLHRKGTPRSFPSQKDYHSIDPPRTASIGREQEQQIRTQPLSWAHLKA